MDIDYDFLLNLGPQRMNFYKWLVIDKGFQLTLESSFSNQVPQFCWWTNPAHALALHTRFNTLKKKKETYTVSCSPNFLPRNIKFWSKWGILMRISTKERFNIWTDLRESSFVKMSLGEREKICFNIKKEKQKVGLGLPITNIEATHVGIHIWIVITAATNEKMKELEKLPRCSRSDRQRNQVITLEVFNSARGMNHLLHRYASPFVSSTLGCFQWCRNFLKQI